MNSTGYLPRPRAVIFDFNGTISDDEPILERLFREVFAEDGIVFSPGYYYARLAGLSDPEIVERALGDHDQPQNTERAARLLRAKVDRYKELVAEHPTISDRTAAFVGAVAARVPIAIASGALREEVEHVLAIASLRDLFLAVVCIDDVPKGKPEPDGFLLALERLNAAYGSKAVGAHEVLVFEDADVGVAAAHAAGMRTIAIANPAYRGHLGAAEAIIDELRPEDVPQLLG